MELSNQELHGRDEGMNDCIKYIQHRADSVQKSRDRMRKLGLNDRADAYQQILTELLQLRNEIQDGRG